MRPVQTWLLPIWFYPPSLDKLEIPWCGNISAWGPAGQDNQVDCTRIALDPRFKNMEGSIGLELGVDELTLS